MWELFTQQPDLSQKISQKIGGSSLVAQILLNRGIRSVSDAMSFLFPDTLPVSTFDSDLLTHFYNLILQTRESGKKILVYGDYDVDGMTSVSMMVTVLQTMGCRVDFWIPHRFDEGYGLTPVVIPRLLAAHATDPYGLIITLDCGGSSLEEIASLREAGLAVAVLDHHTLPTTLPNANVLIHPKQLDPTHPLWHLCTAGIVLQVIQYLATRHPGIDPSAYWDLAALGTIADVATLKGENRRIVSQGLLALNKRTCVGLDALLTCIQFNKTTISVRDVGFSIAPHLNAAGRIHHASLGVRLLLEKDPKKALALSEQLHQLNTKRQSMGQLLLKEAQDALSKEGLSSIIVLSSPEWHGGIIGIIASRLAEKHSRPVVLIAVENGIGRGSARTIGNINIYDILRPFSHFFISFGGHKEAAGFSIEDSQIPEFKKAILAFCHTHIHPNQLEPVLSIDAVLQPDQLSDKVYTELCQLGPFGAGNPQPLFYINSLNVIACKPVGDGSHIKVVFTDKEGKNVWDGIGFGLAHKLDMLYKESLEVLFRLEMNYWQNTDRLQLSIVDVT